MKPVAWRSPDGSMREDEGQGEPPFDDWTPLYARPAPLSDERIAATVLHNIYDGDDSMAYREAWTREIATPLIRAIERELFEGE